MRAIVQERYGEPAAVLELRSLAAPTPPAASEVLVRVTVRPVHPGDLSIIVGPGDGTLDSPQTPGLEGAGIVEAVGSEVSRLQPGARVAFFPAMGAWREYVTVAADSVIELPESVSDEIGSVALINPATMLELMREARASWDGPPRPILQTAAGSSVGTQVSAEAVRNGYPLVNLVRSAEGAAALAKRFPTIPTFSSSELEWRAKVREALGGAASVILDAIGGELTADFMGLLEEHGTVVSYGALGGPAMTLPSMPIVQGHLRLHGVSIGRWMTRPSAERAVDMQFATGLAAEHPELFDIAGTYDLSEFPAAIKHARRAGKVGTVLLTSPTSAAGPSADR